MELLERFAAGDLEAFEALFRQHQKEVYAWTVRIVRDSGAAEDLTVETFWRIYRARQRFDPAVGNFRAWARRIATNAALDHLRHARKEIQLSEDFPAAPRGDPAARAEIAAAVGISPALVKVRVFRAVRLLRRKLNSVGLEVARK